MHGSPAHAGIGPDKDEYRADERGFPRTRGDRPGPDGVRDCREGFPRTREDRPRVGKIGADNIMVPPHTRG